MSKILDTLKLMKKESKSLGLRDRMNLYKDIWDDYEKFKSVFDRMYNEFEKEIFQKILKGKDNKLQEWESQGGTYRMRKYTGDELCLEFYFQHQGIFYTLQFAFVSYTLPIMSFFLAFDCSKMKAPTPQENQLILAFLKRVKKVVTPLMKELVLTEISNFDPDPELIGDIPMDDDIDETIIRIIGLVLEQRESGE